MFRKCSNIVTIAALVLFLFSVALTAQTKKKSNDAKKTECSKTECSSASECSGKSEMKEASNSKIWNKVCPIMGEKVDAAVATVQYEGKTIGFCCKKCVTKFQKDPAKYMKNLSEDGSKFIKG